MSYECSRRGLHKIYQAVSRKLLKIRKLSETHQVLAFPWELTVALGDIQYFHLPAKPTEMLKKCLLVIVKRVFSFNFLFNLFSGVFHCTMEVRFSEYITFLNTSNTRQNGDFRLRPSKNCTNCGFTVKYVNQLSSSCEGHLACFCIATNVRHLWIKRSSHASVPIQFLKYSNPNHVSIRLRKPTTDAFVSPPQLINSTFSTYAACGAN